MSSQYKFVEDTKNDEIYPKGRVKVTDLLQRLNIEKKRQKQTNLVLSVAAISALTVFGIILSI
jgi:hypothetical protein